MNLQMLHGLRQYDVICLVKDVNRIMSQPKVSPVSHQWYRPHPPMPLINVIPCCVPFRPPSTAMTVGIPPVEAECLLEDRKGGNVHPVHTFIRMYIQIPRHFFVYISNCMYSLKVPPPLVCQIFYRNSRKVNIRPRGAGGLWSLPNPESCKSTFKNLRY